MSLQKHLTNQNLLIFKIFAIFVVACVILALMGIYSILDHGLQRDKISWCGAIGLIIVIGWTVRKIVVSNRQLEIVYRVLRCGASIFGIRFHLNGNDSFSVEIPYNFIISPPSNRDVDKLPKQEVLALFNSAVENGDVIIKGVFPSDYSIRNDGKIATIDDVLYEIAIWGASEDFDYENFPLESKYVYKSNYSLYPNSVYQAIYEKKIRKARWSD